MVKKIIISEDTEDKYNDIKEVVLSVYPDAEITRETRAITTVHTILENHFDYHIQDMQMPLREDNEDWDVEIDGGETVLTNLVFRKIPNPEMKSIICSSGKIEDKTLKICEVESAILYDFCSDGWVKDLETFLKS